MKKHFMNDKEKEEMMSHVAMWKKSGISTAAYCKQHGINPSNFYRYKVKAEKGKPKAEGFVRVLSANEVFYDVIIGKAVIKVPAEKISEFIKEISAHD